MARIDLHCHTSASFDSSADPVAMVTRARDRGLTHVIITDHDTIDGALEARDGAPEGIEIIVGCELLTTEGDLIVAFLEAPLPVGLSARDAIAAARERGALVGIPHPFDRSRRSLLRSPDRMDIVPLVDWVETRNGRVTAPAVDEEAEGLARRTGISGVGASDAHTLLEVGTTYTELEGDITGRDELLAALRRDITIHSSISEPETARKRHIRRLSWRSGRAGR